MEPPLFAQDQETEEGFGSLGTHDAIAQRFQAEDGVPVALDKPERGDDTLGVAVSSMLLASRCLF